MSTESRKEKRARMDREEAAAEAKFNASLKGSVECQRKFDVVRQRVRDVADTGAFEPITGIINLPAEAR